ncbi:FecCD family ABC transporter permease [Xenorhabdus siamensis]|uniref:FecCD family ABC transporter permease n=1 Tax=Xenorhabdus siamensis TaxID=3136254 RepID=UPI0030F3D550
MKSSLFFIFAPFVLLLIFFSSLSFGVNIASVSQIYAALTQSEPQDYEQAVILYQRLPRALISVYVGAVMACSGLVFQGLIRNPLASSSTLGINAGATLFVIIGAISFGFDLTLQGIAALVGGLFGFLSSLAVSRLAGVNGVSRNLLLILSGTLIAMLYLGISNAVLLAYPALRTEYLSWLAGAINHAYITRLHHFWWFGILALMVLLLLARPLTLILLGYEKALSIGANAMLVSHIALISAIVASSSAVAICGPIGFVGLVVPHIVKPLVGQNFMLSLPACALTGASVCLIANLCAQTLFQPYVIHTGILMDFLGGLFFIWIIRKRYLSTTSERSL